MAREKRAERDARDLADHDHDDEDGDGAPVSRDERGIDHHADRHEEQHGERVTQRQRVGGRLLALLEACGLHVRCLTRRPEALSDVGSRTEVVVGDVLDEGSLRRALEGVDTAYYLVHSMGSAGSFERSADAIRIGEDAARAIAASLSRYSLPEEQYKAFRRRQIAEQKPMGSVDEIRFEGLQRSNPEVLRSLLESKPGDPLTEEKVSADLRRIYGRGDFESVDYYIEQNPGKRVLVVQPREKEWGPDYVRFGLGLATDFQGENYFNILAQYRRTWLNRLGGEWLNEVQVGKNTFFSSEFIQPVEERGRYFVAPYVKFGQDLRGVFFDEQRVGEYQTVAEAVAVVGLHQQGALFQRASHAELAQLAAARTGQKIPRAQLAQHGPLDAKNRVGHEFVVPLRVKAIDGLDQAHDPHVHQIFHVNTGRQVGRDALDDALHVGQIVMDQLLAVCGAFLGRMPWSCSCQLHTHHVLPVTVVPRLHGGVANQMVPEKIGVAFGPAGGRCRGHPTGQIREAAAGLGIRV